MFKIYPVHLATLKGVDHASTTYLTRPGVKHDLCCIAWVIKSDRSTYVVDPGPGKDIERAKELHGKDMVLNANVSLSKTLNQLGVAPADITAVLNTHLHWDHCLANDEFPDAPVIVQRKDYEYAQNPLKANIVFYESDCEDAPVYRYKDRLSFVEGDTLLEDGLELILTPGHTPGHQSVKVTTAQGDYILSGDQFDLYENYEQQIPVGIHVNLFDWYHSYDKIKAMNAIVLPSHDELLLKHKVFG